MKEEANQVLHENKVLQILEKYGKPHISGSYALDLMTWRDLDIYLQMDCLDEQSFFDLGAELCKTLYPVRMQFRDERLAKTYGLPDGFYWGIYLGNEREGAWKIDVWAVSAQECERLLAYCNGIKSQLDDSKSSAILSIKSQCWQDPEYRRIYSSTDIYEAVLRGGIRDLEGLWKYLDG